MMHIFFLPAKPLIDLHFFLSDTVSPTNPFGTSTFGLKSDTRRTVPAQMQCAKQVLHVQDIGTSPQFEVIVDLDSALDIHVRW
jgi:hypothetical protein